jgi:hypothetical protein
MLSQENLNLKAKPKESQTKIEDQNENHVIAVLLRYFAGRFQVTSKNGPI